MRKLYPLCLSLLLLASCAKEEQKKPIDRKKTDWVFYNLEGNVNTVKLQSYAVVNNSPDKTRAAHEVMSDRNYDLEFNDRGMLVLETSYTSDFKPFSQTTFKNGREKKLEEIFYSQGEPISKTQYTWDKTGKNNTSIIKRNPDNSQIEKIVMNYDNGKLSQKITYNGQNNSNDKITYRYDHKGNVTDESYYLNSEYIQFRKAFEYNDKNQKVREKMTGEGKVVQHTVYDYSGDKIIGRENRNGNNELEYLERFSYDTKGNLLEQATFEREGNINSQETYTYDAKGNRASWQVKENDVVLAKETYRYDNKNNIIELTRFDQTGRPGEKRNYTYQYDTHGNWTRKSVAINGKPAFVVERKITYFEE